MACQFNKMLFCLSERYIYEINQLLSGVANVFTFLRTGTSDKQTHSTTFMNEGSSKILKRILLSNAINELSYKDIYYPNICSKAINRETSSTTSVRKN